MTNRLAILLAATLLAGCAGHTPREGNLNHPSSFTLESPFDKPNRPSKPRRPRAKKPVSPKPSAAEVIGNPAEENLRKGRFDPQYSPHRPNH